MAKPSHQIPRLQRNVGEFSPCRRPGRQVGVRLGVAMLLAAVCLNGIAAERAGDWPAWRGPQRDAISSETGLLTEWGADGPPLLWKVGGLGSGYSSISVADGRIFTMGRVKGQTAIQARSLADGHLVWTAAVPGGNPNCTPTVDGGLVYALGRDGDLVCVTAETGERVWSRNFGQDFGGKMMSGWGYSESPLIDGDKLLCTPGSPSAAIAALDKKTGDVIWTTNFESRGERGRDGAAYSSIVVSNAGGVRQYVQLSGRGLLSVDAGTGAVLWTYNRIANGTANIPTPLVKDDYVFCSTGYGTGAALLKVQPGAKGVEEVYFLDSRTLQNHHGGMVLLGDYIYCGHGHNKGFPLCIALKTGEVVWGPVRGAGSGSAAVLYADGHLYFRYEDGTIALIEATPEAYTLKGSFKMATQNGKSWPHPVIVDGRLYLRDQDDLLCYDVRR